MAEASRKKTVLLVDDSPSQLEVLEAAFEEAGWDVGLAGDGEEVFRKITAYDPDAVLLDVYMPKINGADVCRLVKAHPHWRKTYLVIMSARMSDKDAETYRRLGADEILKKPFEAPEAVALLEKGLAARAK